MLSLLGGFGIKVLVEDRRNLGVQIPVSFSGTLWGNQEEAVNSLTSYEIGVLSAGTGFGKTVVAAAMIAKRGVNTLVLVHRQQLIDQWRERLMTFLNLTKKEIGQIGAGRSTATGLVDIGMLQSMVREGRVKDEIVNYGHIIVDECHHVSAFSFEQVLRQARAKYILGLTATLKRKDGKHPIIVMQCGPVRYAATAKRALQENKVRAEVIVRATSFFQEGTDSRSAMHDLYNGLAECEHRNQQLVADVAAALRQGRSPLVLTERTRHLELIQEKLKELGAKLIILRGGMGIRQRKAALQAIAETPQDQPRVILATGRYIGEGFDDARLDTLFLAMPISWTGTLQQYVGRLHRLSAGKDLLQVYDYVDSNVPLLLKMFQRRSRGYRALGYQIIREPS